jgi:hypothetical protein
MQDINIEIENSGAGVLCGYGRKEYQENTRVYSESIKRRSSCRTITIRVRRSVYG